MNCKPLENKFSKGEFEYEQVLRDGKFAIYRQSTKRFKKCWYESIEIKTRRGFKIGERSCGPSEVYPASEKWGLLGFTYDNIDDAKKRIERMKSENKK